MKLNQKETTVLRLLADGQARRGLALVEASDNVLKRGVIYVTLMRMEDHGLIASHKEEDKHRNYTITDRGREALGESLP